MIITPGEISVGDYLVVYEEIIKSNVKALRGLFGGETGEYEEIEENIVVNTPWLKGIPFEVLGVALPIIMVRNMVPPSKEKPLAPTMFLESRMMRFLKVDKEYVEGYINAEKALRELGQEGRLNACESVQLSRVNILTS